MKPEQFDLEIGAAIRLHRKQAGMSQVELAEACGVTFQQIQKYENGANRISFSRLVLVAHALGCRVGELIGEIDSTSGLPVDTREALKRVGIPGAPDMLQLYEALTPRFRRTVLLFMRSLVDDLQELSMEHL